MGRPSSPSRAGKTLSYLTPRGQCVLLLLAALRDLRICATKHETIRYIIDQHWFETVAEDFLPYPSALTREPRWHCLLAWARKDALLNGWLFNHDERDSWQINRDGQEVFEKALLSFRDGRWAAANCFLWTGTFKKRMSPAYVSTPADLPRRPDVYRDTALENFARMFYTG